VRAQAPRDVHSAVGSPTITTIHSAWPPRASGSTAHASVPLTVCRRPSAANTRYVAATNQKAAWIALRFRSRYPAMNAKKAGIKRIAGGPFHCLKSHRTYAGTGANRSAIGGVAPPNRHRMRSSICEAYHRYRYSTSAGDDSPLRNTSHQASPATPVTHRLQKSSEHLQPLSRPPQC
jgi:hypothetical protein